MSNIGTIIKAKNEKRGNRQVAALTGGFDKREHTRKVEENDRRQVGRSNGSVYSDRTPFFDGYDHINLWDRAKTPLGRALAMDSDLNFEVPGLGKFRSFYALWVYLTTKNRSTAMCSAPAYKLRQMARERKDAGTYIEPENYRYVLMSALWNYVTADKQLVDAIITSGEVPLVSYIEQNGMRQSHSQSKWWLLFVKMVRAQLIAGEDLDMEFLRDAPGTYDKIVSGFRATRPQLGQIARAPKEAKPVKAKPTKKEPVKTEAKPEEVSPEATGRRQETHILGYLIEDLKNDFARKSGNPAYFMAAVADPEERRRMMWTAPGVKAGEFEKFLNQFETVSITNEAYCIYFFFDTKNNCIGASTCLMEDPFGERRINSQIDGGNEAHVETVKSMVGHFAMAYIYKALRVRPSGLNTRQELVYIGDGQYGWQLSEKSNKDWTELTGTEPGLRPWVAFDAPLKSPSELTKFVEEQLSTKINAPTNSWVAHAATQAGGIRPCETQVTGFLVVDPTLAKSLVDDPAHWNATNETRSQLQPMVSAEKLSQHKPLVLGIDGDIEAADERMALDVGTARMRPPTMEEAVDAAYGSVSDSKSPVTE